MKAILLCAGRGSRLMPLTEDIPKTLVKIKELNEISRIEDIEKVEDRV